METKNIVAAISLSAAVIILYSLFFVPTPEQINKPQKNLSKNQTSDTPVLDTTEEIVKISKEM